MAVESLTGRTALHEAILRQDAYYKDLHWLSDTPAWEALNAMLQHPTCDMLLNMGDDFNNPPFIYALRAYARSGGVVESHAVTNVLARLEIIFRRRVYICFEYASRMDDSTAELPQHAERPHNKQEECSATAT